MRREGLLLTGGWSYDLLAWFFAHLVFSGSEHMKEVGFLQVENRGDKARQRGKGNQVVILRICCLITASISDEAMFIQSITFINTMRIQSILF